MKNIVLIILFSISCTTIDKNIKNNWLNQDNFIAYGEYQAISNNIITNTCEMNAILNARSNFLAYCINQYNKINNARISLQDIDSGQLTPNLYYSQKQTEWNNNGLCRVYLLVSFPKLSNEIYSMINYYEKEKINNKAAEQAAGAVK